MLKAVLARMRQGHRTVPYPGRPPVLPERFRGLPVLDGTKCRDACAACVEACPTKATIFGARDDLVAEAHRRIRENRGKYIDKVVGETELLVEIAQNVRVTVVKATVAEVLSKSEPASKDAVSAESGAAKT